MEANKEKINCSPLNRHKKKSSYITQIENERNLKIAHLQQSHKQLSYSTFLDLHQVHIPFTSTTGQRIPQKQREASPRNQEVILSQFKLIRARSLKIIADHKPIIQTVEKTANDLTENMVRLKVEQITFKYKTKISFILKEMNITMNQMVRFNNIAKTDDILNFLSQKVRERIARTQISEQNFIKARSKSKEANKDYQIQRQILKNKLQQKQNIEKQLKNKVRDSQQQAKELLNRISQKEKQLSLKMDQLYQQKMRLGQQQKLISRLQQTCDNLQKQNKNSINQLSTESKDIITINKQLQQQNGEFAAIMGEFKDQIQQYKEKQTKLMEINKQLNEQVIRWRERYQDGPLTLHEKQHFQSNQADAYTPRTPQVPSMKKSTLSMSNYGFAQKELGNSRRFSTTPAEVDNVRLLIKVQQLQKKNKQLSRDILNYATIKQRYQQNLAAVSVQSGDISKGLDFNKIGVYKQNSVDLYKVQLEAHYKNKIEQVVKSWKDKLYEIVHKYQDQLQDMKEEIDKFQSQKQEMEGKIFALANQKYIVQSKFIQKERQIYQMSKLLGTNSIYYQAKSAKQGNQSYSFVLNQQQLKPALSQVTQVLNEGLESRIEHFQGQNLVSEIKGDYADQLG